MKVDSKKPLRIFTIGHSNLSFEQFASLLREFGIHLVVDIRRYPSSRKFPHFNREVLGELLESKDIRYLWLEALGGRRYTEQDDESPNTGLESPGFRNYADHMATTEFRIAVQKLLSTAVTTRTAVMCAEKFYWKCHRRLLSDYLTVGGVAVKHILESGKLQAHKLSQGAVITTEATVVYPPLRFDDMQIRELFKS